jgi:type IV pilus assembly protein PilZ
MSQQRQHTRVPVALKVSYLSRGDLAKDIVANLSSGGLFIRTKKPLPIGSEVELEISVGENEPPIAVRGQVVWLKDQSVEDGMGIRFTGTLGPMLLDLVRPKP